MDPVTKLPDQPEQESNAEQIVRSERIHERPRRGLLAGMRIRKKLVYLHTIFSLTLAAILLLTVRPAVNDVVSEAEWRHCRLVLELLASSDAAGDPGVEVDIEDVEILIGADAASVLGDAAAIARSAPGTVVRARSSDGWPIAGLYDADKDQLITATMLASPARRGVLRLYALLVIALLAVYGFIVLTLEAFVLPKQVYGPIRMILRADRAVQEGRRDAEIIPTSRIPSDELGEIMRSRNESIMKLRTHEADLADALERLEVVANDLKRKNHLLEMTRRNMADQDRLVSLGMMSAGIAHELNTPLAVLKGCVEGLAEHPEQGVSDSRAQLMLRVVHRLERLSESLLDFARARPPATEEVDLRAVVEEAWTLVRLDREIKDVEFEDDIEAPCMMMGDGDQLTQVFVNILRNAADAMNGEGAIRVASERRRRDGAEWVSITCADTGPGIDPDILPRLFEPFTSTRLDARGAGLGLAVAEGIVREHGGVILARNRSRGGAIFEIMLPAARGPADEAHEAEIPHNEDSPHLGSQDPTAGKSVE